MNNKKPLPKPLDIAQFLVKDKQLILPMLDLLTSAPSSLVPWVKPLKFHSHILDFELPVNASLFGVRTL